MASSDPTSSAQLPSRAWARPNSAASTPAPPRDVEEECGRDGGGGGAANLRRLQRRMRRRNERQANDRGRDHRAERRSCACLFGRHISRSTSGSWYSLRELLRDLDARHVLKRATLAIEVHDSIVMVTDESLPLAPGRILHAAILPWLLGTNDDARFLASRTQSFSLLEVGASHGLYALELAARFPKGSFVHLEPNGTAWEAHTALGVSRRLPHALFLRNNITHEVAEALAHSNEFFDAQLLLSLQTTEVFAGIKEVGQEGTANMDLYVAHLLSLARRTLLLLPAPSVGDGCRKNRLATWLYGAGGRGGDDLAPPRGTLERLQAVAATRGLDFDFTRVLRGAAPDGCAYELWSARLLRMDRTNRHHYCEGECKIHGWIRLQYTASPHCGSTGCHERIDMTRVRQNGSSIFKHGGTSQIPFKTGSINLHSVLSLHREHPPPALDGTRQMLLLMFLSLPVFDDPAPWNYVWRGGELFNIDVGDGIIVEERLDPNGKPQWAPLVGPRRSGQPDLIGPYHLTLIAFCGDLMWRLGEEGCVAAFFAGVCYAAEPYPCLSGCRSSYRECAHLLHPVVAGYSRSNVHVVNHASRFALYHVG